MFIKAFGIGKTGISVITELKKSQFANADLDSIKFKNKEIYRINSTGNFELSMQSNSIAEKPEVNKIHNFLGSDCKILFLIGNSNDSESISFVSDLARKKNILTIAVLNTEIFSKRTSVKRSRDYNIRRISKYVDAYFLVESNEGATLSLGGRTRSGLLGLIEASMAYIKSLSDILTVPGYINIDIKDMKTVFSQSGLCEFTDGIADGPNRALSAITNALQSAAFTSRDLNDARYILLSITSGNPEVTMNEVASITDYLQEKMGLSADLIWGNSQDDKLGDQLRVSLIFSGFGVEITDQKYFEFEITEEVGAEQETKPIALYFLADEYTTEEIAEIISFMSDVYRAEGGDGLVIKGSSVMEYADLSHPVLI